MHKTNFEQNYVKTIGELAVQSLKLEAGTTPKPGLVDREGNGAHKDMDYPMFLASSEALRGCFEDCAAAGMQGAKAEDYRRIGLAGEQSMYQVTNHVNTHKGLIFSMGIFCGVLGELVRYQEAFTEEDVQCRTKELACSLLQWDPVENTHGRQVQKNTGTGGIRGEALSGFASVFRIGLPALRKAMAEGEDLEYAMIRTLLTLMCETEDSNVVYRGGLEGLTFVKQEAKAILEEMAMPMGDADLSRVREFDTKCIEKNISPGGSADLLALTTMLYLFFEENRTEEWI